MIFKQKPYFRKLPLYTIVHKLWSARSISIFDLVQKYFASGSKVPKYIGKWTRKLGIIIFAK